MYGKEYIEYIESLPTIDEKVSEFNKRAEQCYAESLKHITDMQSLYRPRLGQVADLIAKTRSTWEFLHKGVERGWWVDD